MISILIPSGILLAAYWGLYLGRGRKTGVPVIVPLVFTCLVIPKVNLITVNPAYSTAGIRIDDLLALVLLGISVRDAATWKNRHIRVGLIFLTALTAVGILGMIAGRANGLENNTLFAVLVWIRKFEYFAFALIGIYGARQCGACAGAGRDGSGRPCGGAEDMARSRGGLEAVVMREFTLMSGFHLIIALLQIAGVCNYCVSGTVMPNPWEQPVAVSTFNGYYEYGQFLCFGIATYLCSYLRMRGAAGADSAFGGSASGTGLSGRLRSGGSAVTAGCLGMTAVSVAMILLTESRSSLMIGIGLIFLILVFSIRRDSPRRTKIITAGIIAAMVAGAVLFFSGAIHVGRFSVSGLGDYAANLRENIAAGDLQKYAADVRARIHDKYNVIYWFGDGSASIRFYRWGAALDGLRQFPVFGYGAGVTHAMDGSYVKLLGESGIAGTVLWLGMFGYFLRVVWAARRTAPGARSVFWMMISVLAASLFIDMFDASKPMEMMWLAVGVVIGAAEDGSDHEGFRV